MTMQIIYNNKMKREQNTYEEPRCKVIEIQSQNVIATSPSYDSLNPSFGSGYGTEQDWG